MKEHPSDGVEEENETGLSAVVPEERGGAEPTGGVEEEKGGQGPEGEEAEKDGGATRIKVPLEPPIVYRPIRKEGSEVVRSEGESDESFRKRVLAASEGLVGVFPIQSWEFKSDDPPPARAPASPVAADEGDASRLRLYGHLGDVFRCALSRDGTRAATASTDTTAKIWDARTGACLFTLDAHRHVVTSASFSRDGRLVVTSSGDGVVILWIAATGDGYRMLRGHRNWVNHAAFDPSGTRVCSASWDRTVRIWDASGDSKTLAGHSDFVNTARFSEVGGRVVSIEEGTRLEYIMGKRMLCDQRHGEVRIHEEWEAAGLPSAPTDRRWGPAPRQKEAHGFLVFDCAARARLRCMAVRWQGAGAGSRGPRRRAQPPASSKARCRRCTARHS